jgi:hypothetical protein
VDLTFLPKEKIEFSIRQIHFGLVKFNFVLEFLLRLVLTFVYLFKSPPGLSGVQHTGTAATKLVQQCQRSLVPLIDQDKVQW